MIGPPYRPPPHRAAVFRVPKAGGLPQIKNFFKPLHKTRQLSRIYPVQLREDKPPSEMY